MPTVQTYQSPSIQIPILKKSNSLSKPFKLPKVFTQASRSRFLWLSVLGAAFYQKEAIRDQKRLLKERAKEAMLKKIKAKALQIFWSQGVQKHSLDWLIRAFKQKSVHDALLFWINGAIKHPVFVGNSRIYGLDLLAFAIRQRSMLDTSAWTVNEVCVKDARVVAQSVSLVKSFVVRPESK